MSQKPSEEIGMATLAPGDTSNRWKGACGMNGIMVGGHKGRRCLPALWPILVLYLGGFLGSASGKELASQCRRHKRLRFKPCVGKSPWWRARQSTPVFVPGESHGQTSLVGYSTQGHKMSDTTEQPSTHTCTHSAVFQRWHPEENVNR